MASNGIVQKFAEIIRLVLDYMLAAEPGGRHVAKRLDDLCAGRRPVRYCQRVCGPSLCVTVKDQSECIDRHEISSSLNLLDRGCKNCLQIVLYTVRSHNRQPPLTCSHMNAHLAWNPPIL